MTFVLFMHAWRSVLRSPIRVVVLVAAVAGPVVVQALEANSVRSAGISGLLIVLTVAGGLVGPALDSGDARQILVRAVPRHRYLLALWAGRSVLACVLLLAQLVAKVLVSGWWGLDGWPGPERILTLAAGLVLQAFALTGVLALGSTLLPSVGDAVAIVGALLAFDLAGSLRFPGRDMLLDHLRPFLIPPFPTLDSPSSVLALLSNMALALLLACLVLSRREIPAGGAP